MSMSNFWDFLTKDWKKGIFLTFIFIFILRLPTLFVEYYSGDVISSFLTAIRELEGIDFQYNKGFLYHKILNFSLLLFGKDLNSFHLVGIMIVFLTSFFIFLLGEKIYTKKVGILASFLYGVYISAFNPEFMAINGEIIYNLFYIMSFYFFYLFYFDRKKIMILPTLISLFLSLLTKFQGIWALFALFFFIVYIYPYFSNSIGSKKRYYLVLFFLSFLAILFVFLDYFLLNILIRGKIKELLEGMVIYVSSRKLDILFLPKLVYRISLMSFYHWILWIFGFYFIIKCFKDKNKKVEDFYIISLTLFLFFAIFAAGARVYFHYFMQIYPTLSILGAKGFLEFLEKKPYVFRRKLFIYFILPTLFVFCWNIRDAYIVKFNNELFYNESKTIYYTRLVLLGHYDDYLLPNKGIKDAINYLKENVKDEEPIYVWTNADEVIFFSGKKSAKKIFSGEEVPAIYSLIQREKGNTKQADDYERRIGEEAIKTSIYFVDISSVRTKSNIAKYGGIEAFPLLLKIIKDNFDFIGTFGEVKIWKKKEKN